MPIPYIPHARPNQGAPPRHTNQCAPPTPRHRFRQGFTLIELLIAIAMIGLLATLLVPSLVRARTVSHDRAALAYAHNVYKVAQAYIADSMVNVDSIPSDCNTLLGYVAGEYSIQRQAFITNCSLNAQGSQVVVAYTGGTQSSITLGQ